MGFEPLLSSTLVKLSLSKYTEHILCGRDNTYFISCNPDNNPVKWVFYFAFFTLLHSFNNIY